jgi:hypothetical protein
MPRNSTRCPKRGPRNHSGKPTVRPGYVNAWWFTTCRQWVRDTTPGLTEDTDKANCLRCLSVIESVASRRDKARRARARIRGRGGWRYFCPYCDSVQIYRYRSLATRERPGSVHYRLRCRCCGQSTWTNHPSACDQLPPELLAGEDAPIEHVDTQAIIDEEG